VTGRLAVKRGEVPDRAAAPAIAQLAALTLGRLGTSRPAAARAALEKHRHPRVTGVVRGELLEELRLELARNDDISHDEKDTASRGARTAEISHGPGGTLR
jgi:hypothetical protein